MKNTLYVGFNTAVELPKRGFLFIGDEVLDVPQARIFDPLKHSFNPLKDIDYRKAREIASIFYTIAPEGENTLTVRNGRRALFKLLMDKPKRLDLLPPQITKPHSKAEEATNEALEAVSDVLASPILRRILCDPTPPHFSFNTRSNILARINRAELGEFDALVLGLPLMSHFKGQIVVPDFGFYGREAHVSLIREKRLIAGVHHLNELPPKLRQAALLIEDKIGGGTTYEDAEVLAKYARLEPSTNGYKEFVKDMTS